MEQLVKNDYVVFMKMELNNETKELGIAILHTLDDAVKLRNDLSDILDSYAELVHGFKIFVNKFCKFCGCSEVKVDNILRDAIQNVFGDIIAIQTIKEITSFYMTHSMQDAQISILSVPITLSIKPKQEMQNIEKASETNNSSPMPIFSELYNSNYGGGEVGQYTGISNDPFSALKNAMDKTVEIPSQVVDVDAYKVDPFSALKNAMDKTVETPSQSSSCTDIVNGTRDEFCMEILDALCDSFGKDIAAVLFNNVRSYIYNSKDDELRKVAIFGNNFMYIRPCVLALPSIKEICNRHGVSCKPKSLAKKLKNNGFVYEDTSIDNCGKRNWHIYHHESYGINNNYVFLPIYISKLSNSARYSDKIDENAVPVGGYFKG